MMDKQLTTAAHGHVLSNTNVWSADGQWIVAALAIRMPRGRILVTLRNYSRGSRNRGRSTQTLAVSW